MTLAVLAAVASLPLGCRCRGGTDLVPPPPGAEARPETAAVLNVGNPARGLEAQPDYDAQAEHLRRRMALRMPEVLPSVVDACTGMLDAVREHYAADDRALATVAASRTDDLRACQAETSVAAAICVGLALAEEGGEWPWWLDQCSRAFPRPGE